MNRRWILAIDAGTTGVTVTRYDRRARPVASASRDFRQYFPQPGWVEHDPEEIWRVTMGLVRRVAPEPREVAAIGITNQRETAVVWDRRDGRPVHRAIVWQCRRTAAACERLRRAGAERLVRRRTGLVLDPYFSATKIRWILDHAAKGRPLAFGTIDTWLLWKLTAGRAHLTDATNASRTLLFDIDRWRWDTDLLRLFGVPRGMLPEVRPSAGEFARTDPAVFGAEVPVTGVAGDQQAALFGQGCLARGSLKTTYGTGCFLVLNTGRRRVDSKNGLLTTLACGAQGEPVYALEGSVFSAGSAVQWLRDGLGLIRRASDVEALARRAPSSGGVVFVPAFTGLGAPWWDADARGAILGLTRGAGRAEIARACLESIAFQARDVVRAMERDAGMRVREMRVDGGATANDWLMQFQADVLGARIVRPRNIETTSLGAALLAGLGAGIWSAPPAPSTEKTFLPMMTASARERLCVAWRAAVARVLTR